MQKTTLLGQEGDATFAIDPWVVHYEDLVFGKKIGKGNFGRVFEGTYFGACAAPILWQCSTALVKLWRG